MVCFQTSKLEVLGVQLRGIRVFNLCLVESNLVLGIQLRGIRVLGVQLRGIRVFNLWLEKLVFRK